MKKIIFISVLFAILVLVFSFILFAQRDDVYKTSRIENLSLDVLESKTINMQGHWKGEDLRENYVLETIKEFEVKNPNIKVNLKWNADFLNGRQGCIDSLVSQIESGNTEWDIVWLEPFFYQQVADRLGNQNWAKDYLVNFEEVIGFNETQQDFILLDPQFRGHMSGVITGPYMEGFYQPFFYNKELTSKMGLYIKDSGMTFEDLRSYFEIIYNYNNEYGTDYAILYDTAIGDIGYAPSTWNIFQGLFVSEFDSLEELKNLETSEKKLMAVRKVLGSIEELSRYDPLIDGWNNIDWFQTRDYVLEDKAVFTTAGASWMYSHWHGIDEVKSMKMVPVQMPVYSSVDHYIGGYNPMFAVMNNSPVRDESIKLLMEFSTSKTAEKWIRYAKAPTGVKGGISEAGNIAETETQYDTFITQVTREYGGNVYDSKTVDYILGEKYKDLTVNFQKYIAEVMDGKLFAEDAYNFIIEDMQEVDENFSSK